MLIMLEKKRCLIKSKYKVISSVGDFYGFQLINHKINHDTFSIKKNRVFSVKITQKNLPNKIEIDHIASYASSLYLSPIFIMMKNNPVDFISSYNNIKDKYIFNDKALRLGSAFLHAKNVINLSSDVSTINGENSKSSIKDTLAKDTKDEFYNDLMRRLDKTLGAEDAIISINDALSIFGSVINDEKMTKDLIELHYLEASKYQDENVIEFFHTDNENQLLFLYFKDQELTLIIGGSKVPFNFSLNNNQTRNLVKSIMLLGDK